MKYTTVGPHIVGLRKKQHYGRVAVALLSHFAKCKNQKCEIFIAFLDDLGVSRGPL